MRCSGVSRSDSAREADSGTIHRPVIRGSEVAGEGPSSLRVRRGRARETFWRRVPRPGPRQEEIPKAPAMPPAAKLVSVTAGKQPEEHIMKHDIADLATHADMPDTSYRFRLLAECASHEGALVGLRSCRHHVPDLLKHTARYHTRRSAAPEKARGGLRHYPVEREQCLDPTPDCVGISRVGSLGQLRSHKSGMR